MIVEAKVIPGSKRFSMSSEGGILKIHLRSRPERNKANIELVNELSESIGRPVRLVSGATSRKKMLEIGMTEAEWKLFLEQHGL